MAAACWADPLSHEERRLLASALASACKRSWDAAAPKLITRHARNLTEAGNLGNALVQISIEMSNLHMDVTERTEVPQ
jgi:hypothetical protein